MRLLNYFPITYFLSISNVLAGKYMEVHQVRTLKEIEAIKPTVVLVMAGFEDDERTTTWCGDTDAALENINKMKKDQRFRYHKIAIVEAPYEDWRGYNDVDGEANPTSKTVFAESKLAVSRVPSLVQYKDPRVRLIESDISDDYANLAYMLIVGATQSRGDGYYTSSRYLLPIQMTVNYVFLPEQVKLINSHLLYFKGIYNPSYGRSWDSKTNELTKKLSEIIVDEKYKNVRLTVVSATRRQWKDTSDNLYKDGDFYINYLPTLCLHDEENGTCGERLEDYELEDLERVRGLIEMVDVEDLPEVAEEATTEFIPTTTEATTTMSTTTIPTTTPQATELEEFHDEYDEEYYDGDDYFEELSYE